jgi:hypothetical protein
MIVAKDLVCVWVRGVEVDVRVSRVRPAAGPVVCVRPHRRSHPVHADDEPGLLLQKPRQLSLLLPHLFGRRRGHGHDEAVSRPQQVYDEHRPLRVGVVVALGIVPHDDNDLKGEVVVGNFDKVSLVPGTKFTNFTRFLIRNPANFFLAPLSGIILLACPLTWQDIPNKGSITLAFWMCSLDVRFTVACVFNVIFEFSTLNTLHVRIPIRFPIRFAAHTISHSIRIGAYFILDTIEFSAKQLLPYRLKCEKWCTKLDTI